MADDVVVPINRHPIEDLVDVFVAAPESPPVDPGVIHVGDVITGDKIKVGGERHAGKSVTVGG